MDAVGFYRHGREISQTDYMDNYSPALHTDPMSYNLLPHIIPRVEAQNYQMVASKLDTVIDELRKQREESSLMKQEIEGLKGELASVKVSLISPAVAKMNGERRIPTDLRVSGLFTCH